MLVRKLVESIVSDYLNENNIKFSSNIKDYYRLTNSHFIEGTVNKIECYS